MAARASSHLSCSIKASMVFAMIGSQSLAVRSPLVAFFAALAVPGLAPLSLFVFLPRRGSLVLDMLLRHRSPPGSGGDGPTQLYPTGGRGWRLSYLNASTNPRHRS